MIFLFAWILPQQEQLHHNFLYSLIAQHAAHSGRVHKYMTLLQHTNKSTAGTMIETKFNYKVH